MKYFMADEQMKAIAGKKGLTRIFSGWWIVLTSGVLAMWGHGYYTGGFSALFKPISTELKFSRAVTSIPASIGRFEGGFEAPLAGWLTDKFGPRGIVIPGVFVIGVGLILMYFVNSLWSFYLVWGLILGSGINMALSTPLDTSITNWFVKKRGVALSIKWIFSGMGAVLVVPLIAWLITTQGWRVTCVVGGVVMLVVGLPLTILFLKQHRPEYYGLLPDGAKVEQTEADMIDKGVQYAAKVQEVEFTLRQALRTPAYWLLILVSVATGLASSAINMHTIPFLTDLGIEPIKAAAMMSMMFLVSLPARLLGGFLADRVSKNRLRLLIGCAYFLQATGLGVYLFNRTLPMIYVWFVLYGIGMGAAFTLSVTMMARYFGRKAFGSIRGTSTMFQTPIGVLAPIYAGWVYDTTGAYINAFIVFAIGLTIATLLIALIVPPKPPAKVTGVREIV